MTPNKRHQLVDDRRAATSSPRLFHLPTSIFGIISCFGTLCDITRFYCTCHHFHIIGTTIRSTIMHQLHLKPSTLQYIGSFQHSCYRFTNIAVVDCNESKEIVSDGTINALSKMTSLISLAMVHRFGMECRNWKQLSSLQSLRYLVVSIISPQS
jgi:hypothetical protein